MKRFHVLRFTAVATLGVLFATVPSPGQESVEGRLLQILKDRGVITEAEHAELQRLETELRVQGDLDTRLGDRIDEMVARIDDEAPKTSYKAGSGFNWTTPDGKFSLTIQGRIQARLTHEENTGDVSGAKFDEGESNFDVPRARVLLFGHAFEPWWRFNLHFDIQGDTARGPVSIAGGTPSVTSTGNFTSQNRLGELKDAFIEFTKWKPFNIRAGQFKVPYSRQQLVGSAKQEFVDRSIVDRNFGAGRDHGLMFFGTLGGEKDDFFEYYAGIFDGEGENFINNDDGLFYSARIAVNPLGGVPYSESDVAGSDKFKIAIGANAWFHDTFQQ